MSVHNGNIGRSSMIRAIRFSFVLCHVLSSIIFIAKADTITRSNICKRTDQSTLRPMKSINASEDALVKFNEDCKNDICLVHAQLADNTNIATFVLDPRNCFTINDEVKTFDTNTNDIHDTDTNDIGCAKRQFIDYQYVNLDDEVWTGTTIVFETVQAEKSDGRVCWLPDTNDGPTLATFGSTYEITPQSIVYVYELDGYRTTQESIDAKRKYIPETKR